MSDESFVLNGAAVEAAPEAEGTAAPANANPDTPTDGEGDPSQEERVFKQEEVNKIIAKETAKIERKLRREMEARVTEAQQPANSEPPKPADFKNAVDYAEALADFKYHQKVTQHEQEKQFSGVVFTHLTREEQAREKYDDYDAVAYNDDLPVTQEMALVMLESEIGPDVLYWLGQNPKEAQRISELSPFSQAREIGKIETRLSGGTPAPVKKPSSAPAPITPLGSRHSTPVYSTSDPRSIKMSMDEWAAQDMRETAKKRGG